MRTALASTPLCTWTRKMRRMRWRRHKPKPERTLNASRRSSERVSYNQKRRMKMKTRMKVGILPVLLLVLTCLQASAQLSNGKGDLRVMTYNANEGTDFIEVQ